MINRNKASILHFLVVFALSLFSFAPAMAQHHEEAHTDHAVVSEEDSLGTKIEHETTPESENDFTAFIMHHIGDDYQFHVFGDVHIPLPVIIYIPGEGFDAFSSSEFHHVDPATHLSRGKYYYHHGKLFIPQLDEHGHMMNDSLGHPVGRREAKISDLFGDKSDVFFSFSITKNVFGLMLAFALLLLIFIPVANTYKRRPGKAPRGFQGAIEPLILYVKDEIAVPFIGPKKYAKFLPYLLTLFFFIWINNLIGLIPIFPGSANVTGNIAITFTLALFSLVLVLVNANKHFWAHTLWPPGMPVPIKIFVALIELIGIITKPFSLMIRLFANITAGHIIIMSIIGITFIIGSYAVGVATSIFSVAMFVLELLVAAIQAYIFTLLTAQMIGAAVDEGHHGHEEAHEGHH